MSKNFIDFETYTIGAGIYRKDRTALRVGRAVIPLTVIGSIYLVTLALSFIAALVATSVAGSWIWGWWITPIILVGLAVLGVVVIVVLSWIAWMLDEVDDAASRIRGQ